MKKIFLLSFLLCTLCIITSCTPPNQSKKYEPGETLIMGKYEQDNDMTNGKEEIEWIVLKVNDEKILAISKYALDYRKYNQDYANTTWGTSTLYQWLNSDFLKNAFSDKEKEKISDVFVLTAEEASNYFETNTARKCISTKYAIANGVYAGTDGSCIWWLRSEGYPKKTAEYVNDAGEILYDGVRVDALLLGVRPAVLIESTD